jgi:hypothetical protein
MTAAVRRAREASVDVGPEASRSVASAPVASEEARVVNLELYERGQLDDAAGFVVDLLDRPGTDIRVLEAQLGLDEALVVEGHPDGYELVRIEPAGPGVVWAIDGGSCVVADGRSFQVVGHRAARVRFQDGSTAAIERPSLVVHAVSTEEMDRLARAALTELCGVEPERLPDLPRPVDALREWSEWSEVARTVDEAREGDLVLIDGSLHGGPLVPQTVVQRVHRRAVEQGVALAGVVKASTLYWGRNAPLVGLLKRRGDREAPSSRWAARISTDPRFGRLYVGDVFVAHLAPTASFAFRIDVARGPLGANEVLGRVAALADDPAFVGYPYPLARAHQAARVTGYDVVDLRRAFRDALSGRGMAEDDIEVLFQDFHEVLNR